MQNFRTSFFLLLIVSALFAYIFIVDRHNLSTDDQEQSSKDLFKFDTAKVVSLKITSGGQSVELNKSGDIWKIKSPVATEADSSVVNQVLSELANLQSRRTLDFKALQENNSLEKSGLSPAATTIEFSTGKKSEDHHLLLLGRKIFASDFVYARTSIQDSAPVHLVSTYSRDAVDKKLDDLRSRVVIKLDRLKVNHVGIRISGFNSQPGSEYEVVRQNETWSLQKPLTARAESSKINKWLEQLDNLRVKSFVTEDASNLNQLGLTTPVYQIWVQSGDENSVTTLLVGNPVPTAPGEVYAKCLKNDTVFTLEQSAVDSLRDGVPNCRDHHLWVMDEPKVSSVQVENKGNFVKAKKTATGWQLEGTSDYPADASQVVSFLDDLAGLQTSSFVNDVPSDLKPYGLDKPSQKVTLIRTGDKSDQIELWLGKVDKQGIYAKTTAEPFIYLLPVTVADKWPKESNDWRDLSLFNFGSDKITQLNVTPTSGQPYSYDQSKPGSFTTTDAGKTVNGDKAKSQMAVLALLRAVKWLGASQPVYGLTKPVLRIELKTDSSQILIIGADLPSGNKVAQILGQPDCFELAANDYRVLADSPIEAAAPLPAAK